MGQLMDENKCVVQMADSFLVVQDRISRMVIGEGRRVGGTFHFRSVEIAARIRHWSCGIIGWVILLRK